MLFKKEQKTHEEASKVANTLSKIKEIGYTNYFLEPWPGELKFSSYREISEFMINIALFGDDKLFRDSVDAIKSVLYNNPDHEEAKYLKFICTEFSASTVGRNAALGLSVMSEAPDYNETASLLESARGMLGRSFGPLQINEIGTEAAILIILENGQAEDREKAFESLLHSGSSTKYKAMNLMNPEKLSDVKFFGAMLKDSDSYVSQSAAEKLYLALPKLGTEGFNAIAAQLLEVAAPKLLASNKSGNLSSLLELSTLLVSASMYASPKFLEGYSDNALSLLGSENPLAFGTGYSLAEKLLARSLIKKSGFLDSYKNKAIDLEFFKGLYYVSAKSLGLPLANSEIYDAYMKNIDRMFSEGTISKMDYMKKQMLRAEFDRMEENAKNSAAMLFGVLNAGVPKRANVQHGESSDNVSVIGIDEYGFFKNAIDSVMISEIKWQSWLNLRLKKAAASRNPYRAYWNMLRLEAKANQKASKEASAASEASGVFDSYIIERLRTLNLYSSFNRIDNRLYLMHEADLTARFEAMEGLASKISESNKKLLEIVSSYCNDHGVIPDDKYTNEYETLVSENIGLIKELKAMSRK